jgi:serine/threonine protein kinase
MSPEQASGDPNLDARTDIYSLGCVLYGLIAESPIHGPSPQAILARVLTETARPLTAARSGVSPQLSAVVAKAIARERTDRFTTAAEFAKALGATTGETSVTAGITVPARRTRVGVLLRGRGTRCRHGRIPLAPLGRGPSGDRTVAVLPFENEGAAEDDYFADGVTDECGPSSPGFPGSGHRPKQRRAIQKPQKTPARSGGSCRSDIS